MIPLYRKELAELLDSLVERKVAFLREGDTGVVISSLDALNAIAILEISEKLGWADRVLDTSSNEWTRASILPEYKPFRIHIRKPPAEAGTCLILTNVGFRDWLRENPCFIGHCKVLRLSQTFHTWSATFSPWDVDTCFSPVGDKKSPLLLVKEYAPSRSVPADIRPWILADNEYINEADTTACIWARVSTREVLKSLSDEIDGKNLTFKGPPRLELSLATDGDEIFDKIDKNTFEAIQSVARWIFEDSAITEARHLIFSKEFARAGHPDDVVTYLNCNISSAHDSAKIVYELSVSDLGRDTINILSGLRRSVTEENAKISEITRQLIVSLSGSLSVGVALIAARISFGAHPVLLLFILLVIWVYMSMIIYSGSQIVKMMDNNREDWHRLLYRFLPHEEYKRIVLDPIDQASKVFTNSSNLAIGALIILTIAIIFGMFFDPSGQAADFTTYTNNESKTIGLNPTSAPIDLTE
jgi:hypothetical protein